MVQRGVAPPTDDIVAQLRKKFPRRKNRVNWPNKERIDRLRHLVEKTELEMDLDESNEKGASSSWKPEVSCESLLDLQNSIQNDFQAIQVQWEDIVLAASRAKKSTGGGLCQLTPWHIKSAVMNSAGNKCA